MRIKNEAIYKCSFVDQIHSACSQPSAKYRQLIMQADVQTYSGKSEIRIFLFVLLHCDEELLT